MKFYISRSAGDIRVGGGHSEIEERTHLFIFFLVSSLTCGAARYEEEDCPSAAETADQERGKERERKREREAKSRCIYHYGQEEESQAPYEEVCGHKFVRQPRQRKVLRDLTCLACKKSVRGLIREWCRCKSESNFSKQEYIILQFVNLFLNFSTSNTYLKKFFCFLLYYVRIIVVELVIVKKCV